MIKKISFSLISISLIMFLAGPVTAQEFHPGNLLRPGTSLLDKDGDGLTDSLELAIIIPDEPLAEELALASDLAARVNLESLALNFDLVHRESEIRNLASLKNPVLIGSRLKLSRKIIEEEKIDLAGLKANQGLVVVFKHQGRQGIICLAGSPEALLRTGRAFFLRWPYFWEIWGREAGHTYQKLEQDLEHFLQQAEAPAESLTVTRLLYNFPLVKGLPPGLNSLNFEAAGEISCLSLSLNFRQTAELEQAAAALRHLAQDRDRGLRTEILSYPALASLDFLLRAPGKTDRLSLPRPGSSKRLLTPAFKEIPRVPEKPRQFDLTEIFTTKGFYVDRNGDGIADGLETMVIIPSDFSGRFLWQLTTRLVLETAGGTFPLVYLDNEIESPKALVTPILLGQNALARELSQKGKLVIPELAPGQGLIKMLSAAPGSSDSLFLTAASSAALDKTLEYLGKRFPYLTEYKKGEPEISLVKDELEKFLEGKNGAAESYFYNRLAEELKKLSRQQLENLELTLVLPQENPGFGEALENLIRRELPGTDLKLSLTSMNQPAAVLSGAKQWEWEGEEALKLVEKTLASVDNHSEVRISLGLSESPAVRQKLQQEIERLLLSRQLRGEVEVLSAYKPGFFWLTEKILPRLKNKAVGRILIRFAESLDLIGERTKRFYTDPNRWLQELYPVDEILAAELGLSVKNIQFEKKPAAGEIYEVQAFDSGDNLLLEDSFSPRTRDIPYLQLWPGWGSVAITTGWCRVSQGDRVLIENTVATDPERFWDFYQAEILKPLQQFVLKKTGNEPTFSKQPYFKRLLVELWLSEPDYRLGLDEEIISSLEALHDEIYFDTLDFLRAITGWSEEDLGLPADASRSSAPGNVLPVIHPSSEGQAPRVNFVLEDFQARQPKMVLSWKLPGQPPAQKSYEFNRIKPRSLRLDEIIYDSSRARLYSAGLSLQLEKEADYTLVCSLVETFQELRRAGLNRQFFSLPGLDGLKLKIQHQEQSLEKIIPLFPPDKSAAANAKLRGEVVTVPTDRILGPEDCWQIAENLARYPAIRSYTGGYSFEGRPVAVVEVFLPEGQYVSRPRLITLKPSLHLTARQHANEVSSTNYSLKFAELLATDGDYQPFLKKLSVVIQPIENPDGAALALDLWKNEPFHSLHAGRYSALGVEIGYQVGLSQPLLPEARVRSRLTAEWQPDIYLNLHGYPSHEWVQLFSGYSPFLFRDYWIPKGWFTYFRQLSLNIYRPYREAAEALKKILIEEMNSSPEILSSNEKFYARYERWARRWSPFVSPLEIYDGLNIFARRQSSSENRLNQRSQMTLVEETPEVMDETAIGPWLDFLCRQGLTYLKAHARYLASLSFDIDVIEEEAQNRIRIEFQRRRPGLAGK
ncbi:MAG: M14 family metallopeptidase [Candidatus Saccharicenans sp.]|nr:M14 family metallopeptidase [Candidatus Saccharicenans sp.]MDH7493447.1 M14 family metallopeptidase [Candidatus Saccharicenans sp.]